MTEQTRRSVSVKGLTYQRIKKFVEQSRSTTVSGFVEALLAEKLGEPDEEERRKFGEAMKAREKRAEATKAEQPEQPEQPDDFADYVAPILLL